MGAPAKAPDLNGLSAFQVKAAMALRVGHPGGCAKAKRQHLSKALLSFVVAALIF